MDFNGTLATDGLLLAETRERLAMLSMRLRLHVVTADTFGTVAEQLGHLEIERVVLRPSAQDRQKLEYIRKLNPACTAALGNGRNDALMLKEAALGIAIIGAEGAFVGVIEASDVICTRIADGLDLLLHPDRLTATLRC
ncbi:MAG: ATPase P [Deltaproteobacteria bacterium]|nr:ATPase P [Deltaproteobacteria bacterium]